MPINYVTSDRLPNLLVSPVSFLENEEDNAFSAVYLMGILAEQMSSCSAYELLKGKMLVECEVCFCLTENVSSLLFRSLLPSACGRASAPLDKVVGRLAFAP